MGKEIIDIKARIIRRKKGEGNTNPTIKSKKATP